MLGSDSSIGSRAYRMAARIGWTSQGGPTRQDIPTQLTEFVLLVKSFEFPIQKMTQEKGGDEALHWAVKILSTESLL